MSESTEFKVVLAYSQNVFEDMCTEALNSDWEPIGGMNLQFTSKQFVYTLAFRREL